MTQEQWVKAVFVAIPLMLIGLRLIRLPWPLRIPAAAVCGFIVGALLVYWLPTGILAYLVSFSIMAGIYAILSLGLNSQWGLTGHLNFGIAGFFAIGAFTSALITMSMPTGVLASYAKQAFGLEMPFLVGVLAAAIVAGLVAFLIAIPVLKLREDYLAIATLGIAEVIRLAFQNERWLANGPQPLRGIPRPLACLVEDPTCAWLPDSLATWLTPLAQRDYIFPYLVIVALFVAIIYVALERISRSPWGRALRAVREEESSAAMNGKNVASLRIQSFVVGGVIMGIAGALYGPYVISISYSHFRPLFATFLVWVMLMLGGSGNNRGAILGAFIIWGVWSGTAFLADAITPLLSLISEDFASRSPYLRWMLVAILLELIVLYRPKGLLKEQKTVSQFLPKELPRQTPRTKT
nr:branched-chain amino acid ABC transporter permease [uncultured Halomonas sp.]